MEILFNRKFFRHNIHSQAEGAYRVDAFRDVEETTVNGEQWISLVHPESYINFIKKSCKECAELAEINLTPESYDAACQAVGLAVKASKQGDFAAIRPPGHHAGREKAAGFCLFNNMAIATQKLVEEGKKVFILDIDGHHGDGTQEIFYKTDEVFFCSIHQEYAYPFSGFPLETGDGKGKGYTLNLPMLQGQGDKEFLKRVNEAIVAAKKFEPDVIGVSAGFDAYEKDALLQLSVSQHAYYECAYRLKKAFRKVPVFALLEGGYHDDVRKLCDVFIEGINKGGKPPRVKYNEDMAIG